ncbi:MAG TPA: IclR family transcriptional regulator [Trebonia sp.]
MRILSAFTPDRPCLALTELARRSGLPLTTAHRLIATLLEAGLLERDGAGCYHIGLRLWEVASLMPYNRGLRDVALPFMEDLSQVTHENVQLGVREGSELLILERINGRQAVPVTNRVGGRIPMHPSAAGRVMLAFAPPEVQEAVLGSSLERFTPYTITAPAELRAILADVRAQGYAITDREVTDDAVSVAAPIRYLDGSVAAALALVVQAGPASPAGLVPLVQAAVRGISRSLRPIPWLQVAAS